MGLPMEEGQRKLQLAGMKLIAAKKGESIYLYVYCATHEELTELHNLLVTGTVKTIVETLFNKLVSREKRIVVSYTYSEEEYMKCKSYFEGQLCLSSRLYCFQTEKMMMQGLLHLYCLERTFHPPLCVRLQFCIKTRANTVGTRGPKIQGLK